MDEIDLIAIGGGSGGYTAAIRATQLGLTAAVVERDKVGGTCLHRGCIPTKAWLESAATLTRVRKAGAFGVRVEHVSLDYPTVVARQKQVVETLHKSLRSVIQKHKIEIIEGEGRLLSPTQVMVGGRKLTAGNIVIATGSRPREIPGLETDGARILNSDHLLALAARGANVLTSARVLTERTRVYDSRVELTVEHEGTEKQLAADVALVAVGREAVTDNLGLDKTKVQLERGWVCVDDAYRTAEPHVYAVGDAIGGLLLAHVAAAEGFIAAEAIAGKTVAKLDYNRAPRVTYTNPQVASVGMTEQQAKEAGHNAKSQRFSFKYNAMALIEDEAGGFAKVVHDPDSGDLLGVHIIGPHASELISEAALARFLQASAWEVGANIHPHPTLSEVLGEAAQLSAGISIYW